MNRQVLAAFSMAAVLSPLATVCGATQDARARDSAGVRIVENSARKDAPVVFRLGDKPLLEVGGLESNPDEEFKHRVGYIRGTRLSNGGLAVIDEDRVHFFDPQGNRVKIVGRHGGGPQEFQKLTAVCRSRSDTLIVHDSNNHRLSVLDHNGTIVRTIARGENGSAPFSFCLDDGTFILIRSVDATRKIRITRMRTDARVISVLGEFDGSVLNVEVVASRDAVTLGNRLTGEIRQYDPSGKLRLVLRITDPIERITDAEAERRIASTIPPEVRGAERAERMQRAKALLVATTHPQFSQLEFGPDGTIWVQDYRKGRSDPNAWTAFDSTGRILGRLVLPTSGNRESGEVQSFGRDYVTLRRSDADGAISIGVFSLLRLDGRSR